MAGDVQKQDTRRITVSFCPDCGGIEESNVEAPEGQGGLCVDGRHRSSFDPAVEYVRADVVERELSEAYAEGHGAGRQQGYADGRRDNEARYHGGD